MVQMYINKLNQDRMPIIEALEEMKAARLVPFDVPGHKRGRADKNLTKYLGEKAMSIDVNSMKPLDNLCHPVSVIKDAEELAADAFHSKAAFFMVGGTTSSVQAMVFAVVKRGDKIIVPRNVHRSVINALILCGAIPVYINPQIESNLGIPLGMTLEDIEHTILENLDAKALFINNPTYHGICSNLKAVVDLCHRHNIKVVVDEAHGTHFSFSSKMPPSAMEAGADLSAVSMHKSGGSLTQTSFLLVGKSMNEDYIRQIINLTQTTSGSYLLMASLDMARRNMALNGEKIFDEVIDMVQYARDEINQIGGYYAFGEELINGTSIYDFDTTKLCVNTLDTGLTGIEVYDILRDEYDIQVEFGDLGNILAYVSVGDRKADIERLISALQEIKRRYSKPRSTIMQYKYVMPEVKVSPQDAFYANKISMPLKMSVGKVSGEFVMCYPPGIPILAPGEFITEEIIEHIEYCKEKGCNLTGSEDLEVNYINVLK